MIEADGFAIDSAGVVFYTGSQYGQQAVAAFSGWDRILEIKG